VPTRSRARVTPQRTEERTGVDGGQLGGGRVQVGRCAAGDGLERGDHLDVERAVLRPERLGGQTGCGGRQRAETVGDGVVESGGRHREGAELRPDPGERLAE